MLKKEQKTITLSPNLTDLRNKRCGMTIKEGYYYKTRDGDIVCIRCGFNDSDCVYPILGSDNIWRTRSGRVSIYSEKKQDLIEELANLSEGV